jgi:hypothetical protein
MDPMPFINLVVVISTIGVEIVIGKSSINEGLREISSIIWRFHLSRDCSMGILGLRSYVGTIFQAKLWGYSLKFRPGKQAVYMVSTSNLGS